MSEKIINAELEEKIKQKVDGYVKKATDGIEAAKLETAKTVDIAKAETLKTKEDTIKSIQGKPVEWVAGAFVAGLLIGKILSSK